MRKILTKKTNKTLSFKVDILDIAGKFKPRKNKNKTALQAREYMEKHYRRV
ncbi:hypothetical protein KKE48_05055 [Patescibacteria group bacterium]|nr:hypothetical protein [Patescibacteria group bacterium]MBU1500207.1 hypothetical protein [Patescibacteria group bacterium]